MWLELFWYLYQYWQSLKKCTQCWKFYWCVRSLCTDMIPLHLFIRNRSQLLTSSIHYTCKQLNWFFLMHKWPKSRNENDTFFFFALDQHSLSAEIQSSGIQQYWYISRCHYWFIWQFIFSKLHCGYNSWGVQQQIWKSSIKPFVTQWLSCM